MSIERLTEKQAEAALPELVLLLQDAVAGGASVGFLPPLSAEEAARYWHKVLQAMAEQTRLLLVARQAEVIAGTVQLDTATNPNGRHRAEVTKLLVHRAYRRQGVGRALMRQVEGVAREVGRSLLVLDTRQGDPAEQLYVSLGYVRAGVIPNYARSADGSLQPTVFMYRLL